MELQTVDQFRRNENLKGGTLREVTFAEFFKEMEGCTQHFKKYIDEFLSDRLFTDRIYFFSTNKNSWRIGRGSQGYILARQNDVVASLVTRFN